MSRLCIKPKRERRFGMILMRFQKNKTSETTRFEPPVLKKDIQMNIMKKLSRLAFGLAGIMLMLLAFTLIGYGAFDFIVALSASWHEGRDAVILAISYIVIAIAVFDVAKYFMEEEVIQSRERLSPLEARTSLTKFITTIIIAIFIEGLVSVFEVIKQNIEHVFYPIGLLVTATFIVLCLTVYQRISVDTERREAKVLDSKDEHIQE